MITVLAHRGVRDSGGMRSSPWILQKQTPFHFLRVIATHRRMETARGQSAATCGGVIYVGNRPDAQGRSLARALARGYWTLIEIGIECVAVPRVNETRALLSRPTGVPGS
jgi:hypothetical protein